MRLTSDLTQVKGFEVAPKDIYTLTCIKVEAGTPENPKKAPWEPHNPAIDLSWKITEGDYKDKEIRFDTVEIGGYSIDKTTKQKRTLIPYRLAELIGATDIPWTCKVCHPGPDDIADRVSEFVKGTGENGFEKGFLFCKDCQEKVIIDFDPVNLVGKVIKAGVDVRKGKDDKEYNFVRRYAPIIDGSEQGLVE